MSITLSFGIPKTICYYFYSYFCNYVDNKKNILHIMLNDILYKKYLTYLYDI